MFNHRNSNNKRDKMKIKYKKTNNSNGRVLIKTAFINY